MSKRITKKTIKEHKRSLTQIEKLEKLGEVLTTKQTAEILKMKHKTLEVWRGRGKGPKFTYTSKPGKGKRPPVRYLRSAVYEYLAENQVSSTHDTATRKVQKRGNVARKKGR